MGSTGLSGAAVSTAIQTPEDAVHEQAQSYQEES